MKRCQRLPLGGMKEVQARVSSGTFWRQCQEICHNSMYKELYMTSHCHVYVGLQDYLLEALGIIKYEERN